MYWAVACATRRTLPNVKSSATMPRHPSVPNLIEVGIGLKVTGLAGAFERVDDLAHVLRPRARNHEQCVFGVHDDHVLEADAGDESPVAEDQTAGRIDEHRLTFDRVPVAAGMDAAAELCPPADVSPTELARHQPQPIRLLHHAAVHALDRQSLIELRRRRLIAGIARGRDLA